MAWFVSSIIATILFGVQAFLYKSATEKGADKFLVTLFFMITVEVLALIYFFFGGISFGNLSITLILGFLFALFFYLKTIGQLKALEYLPTNKVFPITSSSVILTVFYALIFFNERLGVFQILGIVLILFAINLIHNHSKKASNYSEKKIGFLFAFLAILPGAAMNITNKYAAISTEISFFILVTYMFSIIISFTSHQVVNGKKEKKYDKKASIKIGILIGLFNFAGYLSYLTALKTGPLSLVAAIHPTFVVITVILANKIHNEELSLKQMGLVLLTVLGVAMLRL